MRTEPGLRRWPALFVVALVAGVGVAAPPARGASDLEVLPGPTGVLSQWLVLGPLHLDGRGRKPARLQTTPRGLEGGVAALVPGRSATVRERRRSRVHRWRLLTGNQARMDLRRALRLRGYQGYRTAFLGVVLTARKATRVHLALGHDDGVAVWLNGRRLLAALAPQSYRHDQRLVVLPLNRGRNRLVLQLTHGRGRWRLQARLTSAVHRPLGHAQRPAVRLLLPVSAPAGSARARRWAARTGRGLRVSIRRQLTATRLDLALSVTAPGGVLLLPGGSLALTYGVAWQRGQRRGAVRAARVSLRRVARRGWRLPLTDARTKLSRRRLARWLVVTVPGDRAQWHRLWRANRACVRIATARRDLATGRKRTPRLPAASLDSVAYQIQAVGRLLVAGDTDAAYLARRLRTVARWAAQLARGRDPFPRLRGRIVKAYRSALDSSLQPYSLYVPTGYTRRRAWPLYVMLHGLHCTHRKALHQMLGTWMPEKAAITWRQYVRRPPPARVHPRALVLAPHAFGDSYYHQEGEVAVNRAIAEVRRHYRVDPRRVVLVGHSMGGTGVLEVGMHAPHRFAGMVSLAGYPSRWIHKDVRTGPLTPWEKLWAERLSPQRWVENGLHLPLIAVHGTKDGPYKSRGLVRAYKLRRQRAALKIFEIGHSVWRKYLDRGQVYSDTAAWRTVKRPARVTFATPRLRWNRAYWVELDGRPRPDAWSRVTARVRRSGITVRTKNLDALTLRLPEAPLRQRDKVRLRVDRTQLTVDGKRVVSLHRRGANWHLGRRSRAKGLRKGPGLEGPLADVHHGPVLVVYGTQNATQRAALRRVASRLRGHGSADVRYPIKADHQVTAADRKRYHLLLVGGPAVNRETARYAKRLPIQISAKSITLGRCRLRGPELGVKLIYPNPEVSGRYLVIVAGTTARGVLRQHLLPGYLPDFVVYDQSVERTGSKRVLGPGRRYRAAGTFDRRWRLPTHPCPRPGAPRPRRP